MEKTNNNDCSKMFEISRVFALISIVCAHILVDNQVVSGIYGIIASFGASAYFIISGYYFNPAHYSSFVEMLKKKIVTIVIPWFFLGTIGFLYNLIASKSAFSVVNLLKWLVGYKTYLYFLTFCMLFYILFYKTNSTILIGAIVINIASTYLTHYGVIKGIHSSLLFTNRIGFFAFGMLLYKKGDEFTYSLSKKMRYISLVFMVVIAGFNLFYPETVTSVIGALYPVYLLLGCFACFGLASLKCFQNKFFFYVASVSFTVYLIHFMCIGVVDNLYSHFIITQIVSVFIVIGISVFAIFVLQTIFRLLHLEALSVLFGLRKQRAK